VGETAAASNIETLRIEFRRPKWIALTALVGCALLVLYCLAASVLAFMINKPEVILIEVVGVVLFGFWGLVAIRRMRQPGGALEISERGVALQCYGLSPLSGPMGAFYCAGFVPWENLAGVGLTQAWLMPCFGLSVSDLDSFLMTRDQVSNLDAAWNVKQGEQSAGILWLICSMEPFARVTDLLIRFMGYTGMPKSDSAKDCLEWNRANWDHHIVIWGRLIDGGPAKLAELIDSRTKIARASLPITPRAEATTSNVDGERAADSAGHEKPSIEASLSTVEDLFHKGLLTEDEYRRKREEIIARL
jgi:hypothetical protein